MKKKKKGSSLLIVIIIMAILFTTGISILTVTASDYKMRINESKKIKNLYEADSGLDIVENIIITTSQQAIKYSSNKIKNALPNMSKDEKSKDKLNEKFKLGFNEYLSKSVGGKEILEYLITNKKTIKEIDIHGNIVYSDEINIEAEISVTNYDKNGDEIVITVQSTFESAEGEFKNKKTVETRYNVSAPEYSQELVVDDRTIDIYPVFDGKIITADGNLTVNGVNNVSGDIWIKGNQEVNDNPIYTFDKYKGGVVIENGTINLDGNIYTSKSLTLKNVAKAIVNGDVYALNAYVGKEKRDVVSDSNNLTINKNLIVNNDLALNATKSEILIKENFYGINDKTEPNLDTADKALKSSSIIVNDTSAGNSSKLTVEKDAYIMGVAYIDAGDDQKYQTGESVAVKGNYLAYSEILKDYVNRVSLEYYNPLHLIDTIDGEKSAEKKAEYFTEYYEENKLKLKSGGVNLKQNVYSVGAYIQEGNANYSGVGVTGEQFQNVNNERKEFGRNVFSMGDVTGSDETVIYQDGQVVKTVENQINFNKIKENISDYNFDETYGKVFLSKDKDIIISKKNIKVGDINYPIDSVNYNALIITGGNVIVKDGVNITGNIIAKGNVTLESGSAEKNLVYDETITRKIIAANYDVLEEIFSLGTPKNHKTTIISGSNEYEVNTYLKTSSWKIVK